jgi:hypothetical protein
MSQLLYFQKGDNAMTIWEAPRMTKHETPDIKSIFAAKI